MKNPLILLEKLFIPGVADTSPTPEATLEFCYDHLSEEFSRLSQESPPLPDQNVFSQGENRETE